MPLQVSSTRAYRQEAKIVLYNLLCTGRPPIGVMAPEVV